MSSDYAIDVVSDGNAYAIAGYRCPKGCVSSASYLGRCPLCAAGAIPAVFPGRGTVWSFTVARIPHGNFPADRAIAYVDLDQGPRVLCTSASVPRIGDRVDIIGTDNEGTPVISA